MTERRRVVPVWILVAAIAVFLVHAFNYLYFFVDDEAIPYVYAQSLLSGHGFSYNAIEGRLEGYSDFLHVLWSTLILAIVRALPIHKYTVFFVGKAVSMLCGIGILLSVWHVARRVRLHQASAITALGTLALAAPFALWSCSSLEAVPVAMIATGLIVALVLDRDGWAAIAASALILERIDGFIYAGVLIGAFVITATASRRRDMLRQIVLPVGVVFLGYHAWRWWYFRDLVPAPVEAKILYKLLPHQHVVVKRPDRPYVLEFITIAFGWPAALALAASTADALTRDGLSRRLACAALPLALYVSVVGDWMFGFRFFVLLFPMFALIVASSVERIATIRPRLAAALCFVVLGYSAFVAARFSSTYVGIAKGPSFLQSPSRDLHRFFWPHYGLYEMARHVVFPGDVVAYNQAGFVPFMLDVNNIDDLGICSRFPADVPSTDIFFTEVGRYAPLTNKTLRPVHAYFLYQNVRFVLSPADILARANHDTLPATLFRGLYELVGTDPQGLNAIYKRNDSRAVHVTADLFTENIAHVSYVRAARIGQSLIDAKDYLSKLPFLRDGAGSIPFSGRTEMKIDFSDVDERIMAINIEDLRATTDAKVQLRLLTPEGHVAGQFDIVLATNRGSAASFTIPDAPASALLLTVDAGGADGELWIDDLQVEGQRRVLRDYVTHHLHLPPVQDY